MVLASRHYADDPRICASSPGGAIAERAAVRSSALKFCRVAEGVADLYPRFGRTMEWDTAAGQAVRRGRRRRGARTWTARRCATASRAGATRISSATAAAA